MKTTVRVLIIIAVIAISAVYTANAQVAINTDGSNPDASAMLDVKSTAGGMLTPRMTATEMGNIISPATGLMVFNTTANTFFFYDGTNWVPFNSNDGDWTVSGNDMYSAVSGNVGIGTTGPGAKFGIQVDNASAIDVQHWRNNNGGQDLVLRNEGGGNYSLYSELNGGGSHMMTWVGNTGDVGIGTTSPGNVGAAKLEIKGTAASTSGPHVQYVVSSDDYPVFQQLNWAHDNMGLSFDAYYNGGWISSDAGSNFQIYKSSDKLKFTYGSGVAAGSAVTWSDGLVLDNSGNVGIGTASPGAKFGVQVDNASAIDVQHWRNNNGGQDLVLRNEGSGDYSLYSEVSGGGNHIMTWGGTTGNVGIGTTSPDEKFEVEFGNSNKDVEIGVGTTDTDVTFITLRSPDGTKYYITVSDTGVVSASTTKP